MLAGMSISGSGMRAVRDRQQVSAHNIANILTPGFRASRVEFESASSGGGVRVGGVTRMTRPGFVDVTGRSLDVLLDGDGFLRVTTPFGPAFTRAGNLHMDSAGNLMSAEGFPLDPPVAAPPESDSVTIAADGTVSARTAGGPARTVGRVELARLPSEEALMAAGHNVLSAPPGTPVAFGMPGGAGFARTRSGMLERSNVNLVDEMVTGIVNRVAFSANADAFRVQDENADTLLNLVT